MKQIGTILSTVLLTMACIFAHSKSSSENLEKFDEIKVFDQINVTLVKSSSNRAEITRADVDKVSIINKDGRLKVKMYIDNFMDGNETNVTEYYSEDLQLVDVNEGAKIKSNNDLEANYLTLRAQEGGEIHARVDIRNLDTKSVSGGKIIISGSAENQVVMVRTGGDYYGKKLSTNQTDVTVFAGGNAVINTNIC